MKKQGTEELWRVCFTDTEDFIRLYFDEVYQEENTLVIERQGEIVSALQLLPYTMLLNGIEFPVSYICGVSTHPDQRGKGMMAELMTRAEQELSNRNIPLALLIPAEPWLFDIYRKYGYSEAFFYRIKTYTPVHPVITENIHVSIAETTAPGLFTFFDRKLRERAACVLHSEADFMILRKDLDISGGKLLVVTDIRNEVIGMAFTLPEEKVGEAFIVELLYDSDSVKEQLLYATAQLYNASTVHYQVQADNSSALPKGMAKVINEDYFRDKGLDIQSLFAQKQAFMTLMLD